tara:strand:- start:59 stop:580 length:522 start_codon:yes stop_codon:yes gene_type:complete
MNNEVKAKGTVSKNKYLNREKKQRYEGFIPFNLFGQDLGVGGTYGSTKVNQSQVVNDRNVQIILDRNIKEIEKGLKLKFNKLNVDYNKFKTGITGTVNVPQFNYTGGLRPQEFKSTGLNIGITGLDVAGGTVTANVGRKTATGMPDENYGNIQFKIPLGGKKRKTKKNVSYNY